jgi:hypothetical protein
MQFLSEDMIAAREPTPEDLRAWFERHAESFALPARTSFRHLFFSIDRRGQQARDDALRALASLAGEPQESERAAALVDPFAFQDYYGDSPAEEIARDFGPDFARAVGELAPGSWQGPVESAFGSHLVFVDSATPAGVPSFAEVEQDVRNAWLRDQKAEAWRKSYAAMREKYEVFLPAPPDARDEDAGASR